MGLFQYSTAERDALDILRTGDAAADDLVRIHRKSRARLFDSGWTIEELQARVDAMGDQAPVLFAKSRALATFIATEYPGALAPEELEPVVPYTLVADRDPQPIVFDGAE